MTASQVAEITGKNVIVIPTKSVPQGISALLSFDSQQDEKTNTENMQEAIKGVLTCQLTYAARSSNYDGLDIDEGDYLALVDDRLLLSTKNREEAFDGFAEKILEEGKSLVSIYYGEGISEAEAQKQISSFSEKMEKSGVEVNLYMGNQPVYYYVISAE